MRLRKNTTAFGFELPETERDPRDGRWSFLESKDLEADKAVAAPTMVAIGLETWERERSGKEMKRERGSGYEFILRKMKFEWERMGGEIEEQQHSTTTTKGFVCICIYIECVFVLIAMSLCVVCVSHQFVLYWSAIYFIRFERQPLLLTTSIVSIATSLSPSLSLSRVFSRWHKGPFTLGWDGLWEQSIST